MPEKGSEASENLTRAIDKVIILWATSWMAIGPHDFWSSLSEEAGKVMVKAVDS